MCKQEKAVDPYWAIPGKLCPTPIEDVSATFAKKSEIPLAILQNFPGNPE